MGGVGEERGGTYLHERPFILRLKDQHNKWGKNSTAHKRYSSKLPRLLPFPCPRIHTQHQEQNVQRAQDIEDLEHKIPQRAAHKQIKISGYKYEAVEALRDEGHAFGAGVAVNGIDEDAFREEVGNVAQDAEDLIMRVRIAVLH